MKLNTLLYICVTLSLLSCKKETVTQPSDPAVNDIQLQAPPAGMGVQIGVPVFEVPQGKEVQRDYYLTLSSDSDMYINKVQFRYNEGSHHCNVFKSDSITKPSGTYDDTFTSLDFTVWNMFAASQAESLDWQLPSGVAIKLRAHQQICIQSHYVNATTQSTPFSRAKVLINFWTIPQAQVTAQVGLVFASNILINIPPQDSLTTRKLVRAIPWDINILTLTGHFHSRGKNFWVDRYTTSEEIYRNQTWDEPPVKIFPGTGYALPKDEQIVYFSQFYNTTSDTIHMGPHVENQEHSNLFMTFYPAPLDGKTIYDIDRGW
ncbi:MAG: hypothetical protein HYR76_00215 [Ignavibacteria bacterium]|nr:hypothetical protein [Ignavibacteria bacterium]MBI3766265.1 hypothetical protein [Ignavibacteriales bacterium]